MQRNLLRNIGAIARALDSISNIEFKDLQLTKGQYLYLSRVVEHPGITQHQLSKLLCVDKTTTNRAITKLIRNGLVVKTAAVNNQKNQLLESTPRGRELYQTLVRESDHSTQVALTGISSAEAAQLDHLLAKMTVNIVSDWQAVKKGRHRNY